MLARDKPYSSLDAFVILKKIKCCEYINWSHIHNSFSLELTNGPNKLDCHITVDWKCLSGTNTLAYWTLISYTKYKVLLIQSLESYSQHFIFFITYKLALNKLDCHITVDWKCLPGTNLAAYWMHL